MKKLRAITPAKSSCVTSFDDLPFVMTVKDVANILGLSISKTYMLVNTEGFPRLAAIGRNVRVPRAKFIEWMEANTQ